MKKLIFSISTYLLFSLGACAQCFTPVSSRAFQTMHIYISLATLHGNNLQIGDEVGIFDGEKCVGAGVLTEELTGAPIYLEIIVNRRFLWWDGFTPGDTITYRFCSGGELSNRRIAPTYISNGPTFDANGSCVVELRSINTAPAVTSVPVTEARPGLAYSYTITAEDRDGDTLTYTALVLPGWLDFNASSQTLAATPGEEDIGDQHVTIRISDGLLYLDHTFIITVHMGNHAPSITSNPSTYAVVGDNYEYTIIAQDIDNDSLYYTAPLLPDWSTFDPDSHVLSGVPQASHLGSHDVTLRVADGTVSADQSFPIFVENVNTPPSFTSSPVTLVSAGDLYVYNAEAMDADGDDLSFSAPTLPGWLSFEVTSQKLHGTPTNDDAGDQNVTLRVTDGEDTEDQDFIITVDFVYGMEDLSSEEAISIYPNPTDGKFKVDLSEKFEKEIILEILDSTGKVLVQKTFPPHTLIIKEFNLSDRATGEYVISVYNESFRRTKKLIIR